MPQIPVKLVTSTNHVLHRLRADENRPRRNAREGVLCLSGPRVRGRS
jgi:hypothetical protein